MGDGIQIAAPCKINLHLGVFDRRSDGFHDLESLFQLLSFGDTLWISSLKKSSDFELLMNNDSVPAEQNIITKAVRLFQKKRNCEAGWSIRVKKRIPLGAGLGGGSSNAASVLFAMNQLTGSRLSEDELFDLGAALGSDVPFFIKCLYVQAGTAYVTGRGERIEPMMVDLPWSVVLVNPGIHSSTAESYALIDSSRVGSACTPRKVIGKAMLRSMLVGDPKTWGFYNDFLTVFLQKGSELVRSTYTAVLEDLVREEADFTGLSGSGSTCFGIFSDKKKAEKAVQALKERWSFAEIAFPLASYGRTVVQ
ncbi:MAG: 4-(cytidine 5'-diphospho)-2-C-methyl-D-erythritol kinase [Termitinemataceae bacterium]